jgi:hypothetical protein
MTLKVKHLIQAYESEVIMITIALMGAGGKMGMRIARNIRDKQNYRPFYVEIGEEAKRGLTSLGLTVTPQEEVLEVADIVILAVPDRLIQSICCDIVPKVKSGTMIMGLDPAAAYAGALTARSDITYFIAHPGHPPLFADESDPEASGDFIGGVKRKQHIVCALHQGPEEDYHKGETLARDIYAPVIRAHRVTVEQMAILEPALVETLLATCLMVLREGLDEVVSMGVPQEAVYDFFYGHMRAIGAIVFGEVDTPLSDGAKLAVSEAMGKIFRPDWKQVLSIESLKESVRSITQT